MHGVETCISDSNVLDVTFRYVYDKTGAEFHHNVICMFLNITGTMLLVTLSVTGFAAVASYFPQILDAKQAIFQYVSGKFSLASNCQVEFHWEDPAPVGKTVSFLIRVSVFFIAIHERIV